MGEVFFGFFLVFFLAAPWHMEVPRPGIESTLQLQQHQILQSTVPRDWTCPSAVTWAAAIKSLTYLPTTGTPRWVFSGVIWCRSSQHTVLWFSNTGWTFVDSSCCEIVMNSQNPKDPDKNWRFRWKIPILCDVFIGNEIRYLLFRYCLISYCYI